MVNLTGAPQTLAAQELSTLGATIAAALTSHFTNDLWSKQLTAAEVVAHIDATIGNTDWQAKLSNPQVVAAIDAALGDTDWQERLTGAQVVAAIDGALANTDWQSRLDNAEVVAAIDAELGNIDWKTRLSNPQVVAAIDTAIGNMDWQSRLTDAAVVAAVNAALGNIDWQMQMPAQEIITAINTELGTVGWQASWARSAKTLSVFDDIASTGPAAYPFAQSFVPDALGVYALAVSCAADAQVRVQLGTSAGAADLRDEPTELFNGPDGIVIHYEAKTLDPVFVTIQPEPLATFSGSYGMYWKGIAAADAATPGRRARWVATADNAGSQPAGNAPFRIETGEQTDYSRLVREVSPGVYEVKAEEYPVEVIANWETVGTGVATRVFYFHAVGQANGVRVAGAVDGIFGGGPSDRPAHCTIPPRTTQTLALRSASSAQNQRLKEGSALNFIERSEVAAPAAVGVTGDYKIAEHNRGQPSINVTATGTQITLGYNLRSRPQSKIWMLLGDNANQRAWNPLEVDVERALERFDAGDTVHQFMHLYDNDWVRFQIIDPVAGIINFVEAGRDFAYFRSEWRADQPGHHAPGVKIDTGEDWIGYDGVARRIYRQTLHVDLDDATLTNGDVVLSGVDRLLKVMGVVWSTQFNAGIDWPVYQHEGDTNFNYLDLSGADLRLYLSANQMGGSPKPKLEASVWYTET